MEWFSGLWIFYCIQIFYRKSHFLFKAHEKSIFRQNHQKMDLFMQGRPPLQPPLKGLALKNPASLVTENDALPLSRRLAIFANVSGFGAGLRHNLD